MQQSSQHDDIKEDIFSTTPNEDPKLLWMKQNPGTTNQELAYMQHSHNSAVIGDVSKFDQEETQVSPENAKDPDDAALEKTNTSVLVGINGSQHEQQSIPSRLPQGFCRTSQDEHDSLPLKQNFDCGSQAHHMCGGESTCSLKKEVVSDILLPAPQSEIMNSVHSLKPGKAAIRSQLRLNPDNRHCSSLSDQVSVPSSQGKILSSITVKEEPFGPQQRIDDRNNVLPNKEEKFASTENDVVLNPPLGGKNTSYVKKEVVLPALQCEKMNLVHSLEPGKAAESSHIKVNPDSRHCSSLPNQVRIPSTPADKLSITVKKEPLWPQHCEDDRNHVLPNKEESFTSMEKDVVSNPQLNGESTSVKKEVVSDISLPFPQCEKLNSVCSLNPGKSAERSQLWLQDIRRRSSLSDQVMTPSSPTGALSSTVKAASLCPQHCVDDRDHALLHKEENITSMENEVVSDAQFDLENFTFSRTFEKVEKLQPRRYPDPAVQGPQSNAESAPPKVLEKGLDGYNWRKYGQKLVKGNKFIRSYYRCTSLNCEAKKQIERSSDGSKTDINYLGMHRHPKPQHKHQVTSTCQERATEKPIVIASEPDADPMIEHWGGNRHVVLAEASRQSIATSADRLAGAVSSSHNEKDDYPEAKRKKIEIPSPDDNLANKPNNDLRHVVQTVSDVDLVNDGYRWRKYGQKLVKGNPNPRSYYRCSTSGCPAKKHVERAFHDSKFVITTYEGKHDHSVPPSRIVSQSATRVHGNMTSRDGELRPTPEERNAVVQEITCGGKTS